MRAAEKAVTLLSTGRVQVVSASEHAITARVRGDNGIYDLAWSRETGWSCTCVAYGQCSHRLAVQAVTMRSVNAPEPAA